MMATGWTLLFNLTLANTDCVDSKSVCVVLVTKATKSYSDGVSDLNGLTATVGMFLLALNSPGV